MPLESVFDEIHEVEKRRIHRKKLNTRLAIILISCILNTVITGFWGKLYAGLGENLKNSLITYFFGLNIIALLLGTVIAIFPYRSMSYGRKFRKTTLIVMMCIQLLFTLMIIINIICHLLGYRSMFNPGNPAVITQ